MAEIASKHQKWDPYSRAIWHVIMNMTGEVWKAGITLSYKAFLWWELNGNGAGMGA
jgi:hypothetical protein